MLMHTGNEEGIGNTLEIIKVQCMLTIIMVLSTTFVVIALTGNNALSWFFMLSSFVFFVMFVLKNYAAPRSFSTCTKGMIMR